jgi:hypothetical protein
MAGRPSKLTPERKQRLLSALASGNHIDAACTFAGVDYTTFRRWMQQGEAATKGEYRELFEQAQEAIAQAEVKLLNRVLKASEDHYQAACWILERRYPDRWSNTQRIKVEVAKEVEKTLDQLERKLPPAIFDQVLAAIADEGSGETETGSTAG